MGLLSKPIACHGCPMYGDGVGWVPDEMVETVRVLILAQNPGADEERGMQIVSYEGRDPVYEPHAPAPLIGKTGYEMEHEYFPLAGLERGVNVSLANVLKCRQIKNGKRTNDMPTGKVLAGAVAHCTKAYLRIPLAVELIVAMGAHSAAYLGCPGSITDWRGHVFEVNT